MTFEEFFKKKKINLPALERADVGLFSEFKSHFEQMGEKSFDHTKKYWFNKLRGQYPLPVEVKVEKVKIENPLSEQTIIASLEETSAPQTTAPKPGFTPRFKAASAPKPAEENIEAPKPAEQPAPTTPKPGFTPRFKAATPPKSVEEKIEPVGSEKQAEPSAAPTAPKPGFTPRFKATAPSKKAEGSVEEKSEESEAAENKTEQGIQPIAQPYKPRFKPGMPPKKAEE